MRKNLLIAALTLSCLMPHAANAQDRLQALPDGQAYLNIAATERTEVEQDLLIATLRIEDENKDAKTVQSNINTLMKKAMEKAKAVTSVKSSTGQYYVYQNTPHNEKGLPEGEKTWRGSQSLELRSTAADDLLNLAGELQQMGLVINGLNYTLSPEKADAAKDSLMEKAIAKVAERAERAAKALNKSKVSLVEINVDAADSSIQPYPMMRAMAMDDASAGAAKSVPVARPGQSEITLTVSARALLKP